MPEKWLPIPGYEGYYEVSSQGRVRSLDRWDSLGRPAHGKNLKLSTGVNGYPLITLWKHGEQETRSVHSLVAEAFLGPRPPGMDVAHRDGTRDNNRIENLRYLSRKENLLEAVEHNTHWQTRKKACPRGHSYSGANLKRKSRTGTGRACRACTQERTAAHLANRPFDPERADKIYKRRLEKEKGNK